MLLSMVFFLYPASLPEASITIAPGLPGTTVFAADAPKKRSRHCPDGHDVDEDHDCAKDKADTEKKDKDK